MKPNNITSKKGFTIMELLIYISILVVVMGFFVGILNTSLRVDLSESSSNEVANQLNFATQNIQRLIRESSAIAVGNSSPCTSLPDADSGIGSPFPCLKLRMKDSTSIGQDPIYIWMDNLTGKIKKQSGTGSNIKTEDLLTDKVVSNLNALSFTKYSNYPGKDIVEINLTLNYNTTNPQSKAKKTITTSTGRVSAATFDSSLIPGSSATLDLGLGNQLWKNLYLKNYSIQDGKVYEPENYDNFSGQTTRGMMPIGAPNTNNIPPLNKCVDICAEHGLNCTWGLAFTFPSGGLGAYTAQCADDVPYGGICFCD